MSDPQVEQIDSKIVSTDSSVSMETKNDSAINTSNGDEYSLKQKTDDNSKKIEQLEQNLINERLNNITIFGVFASLVTFLSVEIQVFKNIDNFWLLIGLSAFLVSSLLLFVFSIHSIARNKLSWKDFYSTPIFWLFILFLLFSFVVFVLNSKGINIDIHIES